MANNAGIFITQVGASVPTAADYQFVFNSDWPSLQTAFEKTVTLAPSTNVSIPHSLGFYPLVFGYVLQGGQFVGRSDIGNGDVNVYSGKKGLYVQNGSLALTYTINVKAFNLDLTKPADYKLPKFPIVNQPYDPTVGIKVAKYGKDIHSTDLRDFILHSRAQSPAVLAVVTERSALTSPLNPAWERISYTNPAGYIPWITGYQAITGTIYESLVYQSAAFGIQTAGVLINGSTTTLDFITSNGAATLVVLRDPLIVANPVQVTY